MAKLKSGTRVYGELAVDTALTAQDATFSGNLTVLGTTTTVNSTVTQIVDALIELGGGANGAPLTTNDGKDRGLQLHYFDGVAKDAFMGWNTSAGKFAVASNATVTGNAITINTYGNLQAGVFFGDAGGLSNVVGANVTGTVALADIAGTVSTAAQPNITSVGSLTSLSVVGNVAAGNVSGATATFTNLGGTLSTAAQPNVTSVGSLTSLSVVGTATTGNLSTAGTLAAGNTTITGFANVSGDLSVGGTITGSFSGSTSAPGATTQIVFNDAGTSNATSGLTFDKTTNTLTTGTVNADYVNADGSGLSNINGGNVSEVALATNVTASAQGNITSVGTLISLSVTGAVDAGSVTGDGSGLNNINGGNVSEVYEATYVTASDQTAITSVGTLISLDVTGNAAVGGIKTDNYYYANGSPLDMQQPTGSNTQIQFNDNGDFGASANLAFNSATSVLTVTGNIAGVNNISATTVTGTLTTAAQPNVTSVGTLTSLDVSGNVSAGNISATGIAGTLSTAAQPSITSVGSLTSLSVVGTTTSGNLSTAGTLAAGNTTVTGYANVSGDLSVGGTITGSFSGSTSAPGANTQIVFNDAGTSNATSGLTFNKTTSALSVSGAIDAASVTATGDVSGATLTGSLTTADQGNITNVGTLTSLTVDGLTTLKVAGSTIVEVTGTGANVTGTVEVTGDVNADSITAASNITATGSVQTNHAVNFANNNGGTTSVASIQYNAASGSLDFIFS